MRFATTAASLILFVLSGSVCAQTFVPLASNLKWEEQILQEIETKYKEDVSLLNGTYKKQLKEIYKERFEMIKSQFSSKEVLSAEQAQNYMQSILQEVTRNNPGLKSEGLRVLFSKTHHANAYSMGEGTIFFNIGLFHRLKNESQVAFILCHELAHYFLDHSNKSIERYITTFNSDEFKKELKKIQKSEYQQNAQFEKLTESLTFKSRRHSRALENAADSMALELLKNTNFDVEEALTALALLDSVDQNKYSLPLELNTIFHFTAYPFKSRWLESDNLISFAKQEKNKAYADSLKTHPDCSTRIAALENKVQKYRKSTGKKFVVDEIKFNKLKQHFDFEIVEYCFTSKRISKALFYSLQLLSVYPDDAYAYTMIGKCLNEIYIHQKKHELGKIVDLPSQSWDKDYNELLQFLENLRLNEIASLAFHFLEKHEQKFSLDKLYQDVFHATKQNL